MKPQYIALAAALAAFGASAQSLEKEIVIDRDIVPELRAVSRLNNYPVLMQPSVKPRRLSFADINATSEIPGMLTTLEPAASADAVTLSPYNGYASIGYFPVYNLGASAGYNFINKPSTSLGAWVQFNGMSYDFKPVIIPEADTDKLHRNSLTAAIDLTHIFRRAGRLDIAANYTRHWLNRPWQATDSAYQANAFNFEANWSARKHDMVYFLTAGFEHFGFNNAEHSIAVSDLKKSMAQNIYSFRAGTSYFITPNSAIAGLVSVDFSSFNHYNRLLSPDMVDTPLTEPILVGAPGKTFGLINFQPSYRYHNATFTLNLGLRAQISSNSGKSFHIAPDVALDWKPASMFEITAKAGGGEHINKLSGLFAVNPYMSPSIGYELSHRPIVFDGAIKIGPFRGFSIKLFAGYAAANDWLMPMAYLNPSETDAAMLSNLTSFAPVNLTAWHGGGALDFKVNDIIEGEVSYTVAPGSYSHSHYLNYDRATGVLDVKLTSRPIDKLTLDAGFQLRSGRKIFNSWDPSAEPLKISLDNSNNLRLGANYAVFEWLSVYAQVENILNNDAADLWLAQQQGIKGLAGVNFKF